MHPILKGAFVGEAVHQFCEHPTKALCLPNSIERFLGIAK
jgi:hypothetical protein